MRHQFTYTCFRLKFLEPSEHTILYWIETNALDKLEYALKHGNYKTLQLAAEGLEHIFRPASIPVLLHAMNDTLKNVFIAALNALEALGRADELVISIIRKRFNWIKELRDKEANTV